MQERRFISTRQYRLLLACSLMLIFTTQSVGAFLTSCVLTALFFLVNRIAFRKISNPRICWGIFAFSAAILGEAVGALSRILPFTIPMPSFFLLPCATFLFLSAPVFYEISHSEETGIDKACANAFLFYAIDGLLISVVREVLGLGAIVGYQMSFMKSLKIPFLSHSSGAALLVLFSLILMTVLKSHDTQARWILRVEESGDVSYPGISLPREKQTIGMILSLLIYSLLSGGIGSVVILYAPAEMRRPEHIVLYATIITALVFTLIIKGFKLSEFVDEQRFLPLLAIIMVSLPMVYYQNRLNAVETVDLKGFIVMWIILVVGVWLSFVACLFYVHVINGRLMFGKQPRCLEGVPFVIVHILLALIVLMPWLNVLQNV